MPHPLHNNTLMASRQSADEGWSLSTVFSSLSITSSAGFLSAIVLIDHFSRNPIAYNNT